MKTSPELLKVEILYFFYSVTVRLFCPFCSYGVTHKTKCYHSLKQLGHHIAIEHKDSNIYPFSVDQVTEIMKILAKALELGILPYERDISKQNSIPMFPRVKRFFDENQ